MLLGFGPPVPPLPSGGSPHAMSSSPRMANVPSLHAIKPRTAKLCLWGGFGGMGGGPAGGGVALAAFPPSLPAGGLRQPRTMAQTKAALPEPICNSKRGRGSPHAPGPAAARPPRGGCSGGVGCVPQFPQGERSPPATPAPHVVRGNLTGCWEGTQADEPPLAPPPQHPEEPVGLPRLPAPL